MYQNCKSEIKQNHNVLYTDIQFMDIQLVSTMSFTRGCIFWSCNERLAYPSGTSNIWTYYRHLMDVHGVLLFYFLDMLWTSRPFTLGHKFSGHPMTSPNVLARDIYFLDIQWASTMLSITFLDMIWTSNRRTRSLS